MADIISEVTLPSRGILYDREIKWQNRLKAPRLRDRGLADTTRRFKLQAGILDNTLVEPLGISAYDLHTADFIYLNMRQRQLSKGAAPYKVLVKCRACGKVHKVDVDLSTLKIIPLTEEPDYTYTTSEGDTIVFRYVTPRILDDTDLNALHYREENPNDDIDEESLKTQEFLRLIIRTVNDKKLTPPQMTSYISSMFIYDVEQLLIKVRSIDWGVQFNQELTCSCGKTIVYEVPVG